MTFDEHVKQHFTPDGEYDLAAAEAARRDEIIAATDATTALEELARKTARAERTAWESSNRAHLREQFKQPTLDGLDLEAKVPLGESTVVDLGDMNHERIRIRKDVRTKAHLRENRAYDDEMTFWYHAEAQLPPGGTIRDIA